LLYLRYMWGGALVENVIWGEGLAEKSEYRHIWERRFKISQKTVT